MSTKKNNNVVHAKPKNVVKQEKNIYKKDNGKKKVSFYIVFVLIIFWTICGCLSIFNTAKGCNVAKADGITTTTSFEGSNITLNAVIKNKSELYNLDLNNQVSIDIGLSYNASNEIVMSTYFVSAYDQQYLVPMAQNYDSSVVTGYSFDNSSREIVIGNNNIDSSEDWTIPFSSLTDLYQVFFGYNAGTEPAGQNYLLFRDNFLLTLYLLKDANFTLDIVKVELGSYNYYNVGNYFGTNISANYLRYVDKNGNSLYLIVPIISDAWYTNYFLFSNRTYYISNDFTSDQYYKEGYEYGFIDGRGAGIEIGYKDGYNRGNSDGYNRGFNAGAESANEYTFLGLIGAVVDAPIQAIVGLLSFNILGVDMSQFFFGILSVAIIIFVVRIFI